MPFYLSFEGRITIGQWWLKWMLPVAALALLVVGIEATTFGGTGPLSLIFALVFLWPSLAVTVKRLHDVGMSGWWILLSLVPILNFIILVVTWFVPGVKGDNKYGPDPRGSQAAP